MPETPSCQAEKIKMHSREKDLESQYLEAKVVVVEDESGGPRGQRDPTSGFEKPEAQTWI